MDKSGVKFGTSGARGLATSMTDLICYAYTKGFLQYLISIGDLSVDSSVAIAGDLRPSTDRIMNAAKIAVEDLGFKAINAGKIPSPAVALYGISNTIPAIMVTGSHIPDDRNGIKFNKTSGEILKDDEPGITSQEVEIPEGLFTEAGMFKLASNSEWVLNKSVGELYVKRYTDFFPQDALSGMKLGFYQHSAVGRDLIVRIYRELGAEVEELGRSEVFIPVDTEAIRDEDVQAALEWAGDNNYDAILSTDGDSDRPLISDENGKWLRGDIAGMLCARYLRSDSVSLPVSCNTTIEKTGWFKDIKRTRIGSPFVVASMNAASAGGNNLVCGYEANGGFLLNSEYSNFAKTLQALPTRDAVILHIAILLLANEEGKSISQLLASLPQRFTASGIIRQVPVERANKILAAFSGGSESENITSFDDAFSNITGASVEALDLTDGIRATFSNHEIIHLRPSGNAPEFRCYNEADSEDRAVELNEKCMEVLAGF